MARSDGLGMAPPPVPGRETRRAGTGDVAEGLREGIGRAAAVKKDLEEALFQWEPRKANELSETLEEELATLNERAPKP